MVEPVLTRSTPRLWLGIGTVLVLALGVVFAVCESRGWPFLIAPLESLLQQKLGRTVLLQPAAGSAQGSGQQVELHLWGGVALQSPLLHIGAPAWSHTPYLLLAQDVQVRLRYIDLWHAYLGQQPVVQYLQARHLDAYLERTGDGRASWQLAASGQPPAIPRLEHVQADTGQLHYDDATLDLSLLAELRLTDAEPTLSVAQVQPSQVLHVTASGLYRKKSFALSLTSTGALPWDADAAEGTPVAVKLVAKSGTASLDFGGTAQDFLHLGGLNGRFVVEGPSLAAVGAPFGVTLPTTRAFKAAGALTRSGKVWEVALRYANVGDSKLAGTFSFDTSAAVPRLTGTLEGTLLKLRDLAPALGATTSAVGAASASKVLPTRPFDFASLRAMNADVLIRLQQVDAQVTWLEPLRPFNANLQLTDGMLTLKEIDARTGQGHLVGTLALDGQQDSAHWVAALNWDGVKLERWIHQTRSAGLPPYLSGDLQGHATLQGDGRSTAEILGSMRGDVGATITKGTISHLLIEEGGLDLAESLGVYVKGDNALVLDCALADLVVNTGVVRPRLLVLDTSDSTVWMDGTLSLAKETLDLRTVVAPKDFSPLTLRSPLRITGTFAHPEVGVEKRPLGIKVGTALLLGLLNPLAAIIPLIDPGSNGEANSNAAACRARVQHKLLRVAPTALSHP